MIIQYLLIFLVLLMIIRVTVKWKQGLLSSRDLLFWIIFWIVAGIIVVLPEVTSFFAELFGVGRGADLVMYFSVVLIFYIIFQIMVRMEKIERNITKIVREMALNQENKKTQTAGPRGDAAQEEQENPSTSLGTSKKI
jgi:hypothetical protein